MLPRNPLGQRFANTGDGRQQQCIRKTDCFHIYHASIACTVGHGRLPAFPPKKSVYRYTFNKIMKNNLSLEDGRPSKKGEPHVEKFSRTRYPVAGSQPAFAGSRVAG
jgi:hypothetical protein